MTTLVDQLRELIQKRDYRVGERLPSERELAEHFGSSRPSVRRAIATLVEHGVLEARDRSGIYFRGTDPGDLLAVRLHLESWAAALAAERIDPAALDRLSELLAEATVALPSAADFAARDGAIHAEVIAAARNAVLSDLYLSLQQRIVASRERTSTSEALRARSLADLGTLIAALHAGDAPAAAAAMTAHLRAVGPTPASDGTLRPD